MRVPLDLVPDPQVVESRHTLTLFCKYENPEHTSWDGEIKYHRTSLAECLTAARSAGWSVAKDGKATCPACNRLLAAALESRKSERSRAA